MGKDNVFFHTVILPNIYLDYKLPNKIIAGSFLLFKGEKFSKSQNIGIFCKDIIKNKIDSDGIRFSLSYLHRDNDVNIDLQDIFETINNVLINKILNCFQRFLNLIYKFNLIIEKEKIDKEIAFFYTQKIVDSYKDISVKHIIEITNKINKDIDKKEIWKTLDYKYLAEVYFALSCTCKLLSIYCPNLYKKLKTYFFVNDFNFEGNIDKKTIFFQIHKNMKNYIRVTSKVTLMPRI